MKALLLAAGEGRRMRPLTQIMPKPLVPAAGIPLAVRQILALRRAGIREIVMNVAYGSALIMQHLGDGRRWDVRIRYSVEGREAADALETLGGIAKALPMLCDCADDAFIAAASDIVTDYDYAGLAARGRRLAEEGLDAHLVLVPNPAYHASGDMTLDAEGRVNRCPKTHTFASFGVYRAGLFEGIPPVRASLFPWLWHAADRGRVSGEVFNGYWRNVGDLGELEACSRELLGNA